MVLDGCQRLDYPSLENFKCSLRCIARFMDVIEAIFGFFWQMLEQEHKAYQDVVTSLARQISMQQFYVEEISRSSGDSGLKQSRLTHTGTRSYHSTSYSGK